MDVGGRISGPAWREDLDRQIVDALINGLVSGAFIVERGAENYPAGANHKQQQSRRDP